MRFSKILKSKQKGFTLIELLVVIGILAILLAITLIAINPARQFKQANDTKRRSDVNAILNAINQYMADNKGVVSTEITAIDQEISSAGADICGILVTRYLAQLPVDPLTGGGTPIAPCPVSPATYITGYNVKADAIDSRITVTAPATELETTDISVTR